MSNVTKGWKTSLIGLAMIGGAIGSVFAGKADWSSASIAITTGVGLLFAPDNIINKITDSKKDSPPE